MTDQRRTRSNDGPMTPPMTRPGDVVGLPKLVLRYPTEPSAIAALLPPGLEPCGDPMVQINVYCVPVHGEPEHGISTKVPARYDGVDGQLLPGHRHRPGIRDLRQP